MRLALLLLLAACGGGGNSVGMAGQPVPPNPAEFLAGEWRAAVYSVRLPDAITFTAELGPYGLGIGKFSFFDITYPPGSPHDCTLDFGDGLYTGGSVEITWTLVEGGEVLSSGTVDADGNYMAGIYTVIGGPCHGDTGTWEAQR